ncbi:YciI family protein [Pseudonocardia sp. TRM90224]|uniref:YciI family protein n=1 Tax=Pseudonocardia sp. TRM90224 TaxID=2812678 RepID=UPI001E5063B3|nr:YciI family protein [Pseudonocardia sp. TRM90224]
MFVIVIDYIADLPDIDAALEEHIAWLDKHYSDGTFLASGRQEPRTGGVIFAHGSRATVEAAVADDPFATRGLARHRVINFRPSRFAGPLATEPVQQALA